MRACSAHAKKATQANVSIGYTRTHSHTHSGSSSGGSSTRASHGRFWAIAVAAGSSTFSSLVSRVSSLVSPLSLIAKQLKRAAAALCARCQTVYPPPAQTTLYNTRAHPHPPSPTACHPLSPLHAAKPPLACQNRQTIVSAVN